MGIFSEPAVRFGAIPLEGVLNTLRESTKIHAALISRLGSVQGNVAIGMLKDGDLSGLLGYEVYAFLSDEIENEAVAVWGGYTFDPNEPLDINMHFPVNIMMYEKVYYVFAFEYDNVGYFRSKSAAKSYIDFEYFDLNEMPGFEHSNSG